MTKKTETKSDTKKPVKKPRPQNKNLKPQNKRTKKEQREIALKGGKASGEARRRKKLLKECFDILLDKEFKDREGNIATGAETLALTVFQKAQRGDLKAFELVRDTAGQKPVEKVMLAEVDQKTIDEVERMVLGGEDADTKAGD